MDFVMTIDDNEVISLEEEDSDINDKTQISNSKTKKTNKKDKKDNKKENKKLNNKNIEKNKKDNNKNVNSGNDIINPEFTFFIDGINNNSVEHPWDFNAARAGLKPKISVSRYIFSRNFF